MSEDDCDRGVALPGFHCVRERGHKGPCDVVMDGDGKHRRVGCALGLLSALFVWAMIVGGLISWLGKPEVKRDARTACERSTPPWAIAERCR